VPPGRLGVPVQADAYLGAQALERGEHRAAEQGAVGLQDHVHLRGHAGTERVGHVGEPLRPREQRLAAVHDDVDTREAVLSDVLGDPLDGFARDLGTHSLGQPAPGLIGHFVNVAI
jgi:hypothetical protein